MSETKCQKCPAKYMPKPKCKKNQYCFSIIQRYWRHRSINYQLATILLCWRHNVDVSKFNCMLKMGVNFIRSWLLATKIEQATKSQTCHQEFLSPTHVINIDAAAPFREIKKVSKSVLEVRCLKLCLIVIEIFQTS